MMFKSRLITLAGAMLITACSYATQEKPAVCPNINAVKSEGLSEYVSLGINLYMVYQFSSYETENDWVFIVGMIKAEEDEVLNEGNKILALTSGQPEPVYTNGEWRCDYYTGSDYQAIAAPVDDIEISPLRLKHFFNK